jgi:hypothetical protein
MRRRKVFGIGWAKTGTTTLGRCFEILGYNHQGQNLSLVPQIMRGDFSKTLRIAAAKESFEDLAVDFYFPRTGPSVFREPLHPHHARPPKVAC